MVGDIPNNKTSWRLDAFAVTSLAVLAALTFFLVVHNFDVADDLISKRIATVVQNAIGLGAGLFVTGWYALAYAYLIRTSPSQLAVRAAGWALLVVATATFADQCQPAGGVTVYGPGGSVGAYLSMFATDHIHYSMQLIVVFFVMCTGLLLINRHAVIWILHNVWLLLREVIKSAIGFYGAVVPILRATGTCLPLRFPVKRNSGAVVSSSDLVALTTANESRTSGQIKLEEPDMPGAIPITRPHIVLNHPSEPAITTNDGIKNSIHGTSFDGEFKLPTLSLLADPECHPVSDHEQRLRDRATLLEKTFQDFNLNVKVVGIHTGPVITQYEVALDTGLRLNKVTTLSDDLALCLGVASVRIVAPLPGRTTVGVEVPNEHRQTVRLKELMLASSAKASKFKLPVFLGKDVEGRPLVYDMATMPHLLIAGRTGTGKSVCLNTIILSFLFSRTPEECRLLLIDPKKVEFSDYARVPHLMHPVVTDDKKAEAILAWAVDKMEERYESLRKARVRNIASYNELGWDEIVKRVDPQSEDERGPIPRKMPYVVIVVDEVGDLLMSMKKEVESHIIRLAQKSRAAGIHLILATQKPTVDVITGLIKSNLPARVCFQVASRADSAVVLDEKGAEKLLGAGDMLFLQPGTSTIIRGQGAYVDDGEIQRVTAELSQYETNFESELLNLKAKDSSGSGGGMGERLRERDPLYEQAIEVVIREQRGSTSLLQRTLGIGYGRASRLVDFMAEDGIVGSYNGSNARDVLISPDEWEAKKERV